MGNSLRIVVADDDLVVRDYFSAMLESLGHQVVGAAGDGRELMAICQQQRPDLVICDVVMPEMTGLEAARRISRDEPVPVVIVSAFDDPDLIAQAVQDHVMAYLIKPVKRADLQAAVALARRRFEDLQALTRELVQTGEKERQRLAGVLHDSLQQLLVAAKLKAELLQAQIEGPLNRQLAGEVLDLLQQSIKTTRTLTSELSPTALFQAGLPAAFRWLATWMQQTHGLTVHLTCPESANPSAESTRMMIFEAVRELLFNIVKHAGVSEADLELARSDDGFIRVIVTDRGRGFDVDDARAHQDGKGFGLSSIRRRLELVGGTMETDSHPGVGTVTVLEVPDRRPAEVPIAAGGPGI